MTQYRLKLLTILANFLITHLIDFDSKATSHFVGRLIQYLDECKGQTQTAHSQEMAHLEIKGLIPEAHASSVENLVIPYGFSLL